MNECNSICQKQSIYEIVLAEKESLVNKYKNSLWSFLGNFRTLNRHSTLFFKEKKYLFKIE